MLTIDIQFKGDWVETLENIKDFKCWTTSKKSGKWEMEKIMESITYKGRLEVKSEGVKKKCND